MLYGLLGIIAATAVIMFFTFVVYPIYATIRNTIKFFLYYALGIQVFTNEEKSYFGLPIEQYPNKRGRDEPKRVEDTQVKQVEAPQQKPNCILSKKDYPNIDKYYPAYKEDGSRPVVVEIVKEQVPPPLPEAEVLKPNHVLSKKDFPNIDKYYSDYKETSVKKVG